MKTRTLTQHLSDILQIFIIFI